MDPRGIVQDVRSQGITYDHSSGMLSPDKCAELVSALHTDAPKGKGKNIVRKCFLLHAKFSTHFFVFRNYSGAELFAKRRKRSEKWIVDETTRGASAPSATSYSAGPTQLYDNTNQYNQYAASNANQVSQATTIRSRCLWPMNILFYLIQWHGAKVNYQQNKWQNERNANLYREATNPIPPVNSGSYIENTNYSPSPYQVPVPSLSSPLPSIKPYSLPKVRLDSPFNAR